MSHFVVDASVAAKWFVSEEWVEKASSLLGGAHMLTVPDLLIIEVENVLLKRVRRGQLTVVEASDARRILRGMRLDVREHAPYEPTAWRLACDTGQSLYDCLYLALAIQLDAPLVTADRRFYRSLAAGAFAPHAVWVGDAGA